MAKADNSKITNKLDYSGKIFLAPMVRIGTLPTRLVALDYGADLVYSEEIIDLKMLRCTRVENQMLGTIDYVMNDETIAFRTCPQERGRVVFQMGTADAERALKVGKMLQDDVAAIDINMGCPKEYSVKGGMGAALLSQPENVKDILTTLVNGLSIPITCKIRILPTLEETLEFVKMVESTGVAAIAVHGRFKEERPRHPNHNDVIKTITENVKIPVIANGGSKSQIKRYEDIDKFRESCGADSVMLARVAQWVPSIFSPSGSVPIHDTVKKYLKYAIDYDNTPTNIKYNIQTMLHEEMETPHGHALMAAGTLREISTIWGLDKHCEDRLNERTKYKEKQKSLSKPKRRTLEDGSAIWEMEFRYFKREYRDNFSPKMVLHHWVRKNDLPKPEFETTENTKEQHFTSVLTIDGVQYASTLWDKSKKAAEQAAAVVYLKVHKIYDGRKEYEENSGEIWLPMFGENTSSKRNDTEKLNPAIVKKEVVEDVGKLESVDTDNVPVSEPNDSVKAEVPEGIGGVKRRNSMPEIIDDMIEKQIRLAQDDDGDDDDVDAVKDLTFIQNFVDRHTKDTEN